MKRSAIFAAAATAVFAAGGMAAAQDTTTANAPAEAAGETGVAARIGGEAISHDRLQRALRLYGRDLGQLSPEAYYRTVLDRVIDQELAARAAAKAGLEDDPAVQAGLAEARANVLAGAWLRQVGEEAATEEALRARYGEMAGEGSEQVRARHILVQTEEEARKAIADLEGGADFAELAAERSVGPSAERGGDLGYFGKQQMVPPFAEAAFSLEKGEFTKEPVQTQFGWHVIKVEDTRTQEPPSFEEMRPQLEQEARTEAMLAELEALRGDVEIERFGPDGAPLPQDETPQTQK